jgi:ABC-type multidrug transport system permease subunit
LTPREQDVEQERELMVHTAILYSGYLIPVFSMQRWLFWIYYINPLNYGFQSLLENEMGRIDVSRRMYALF